MSDQTTMNGERTSGGDRTPAGDRTGAAPAAALRERRRDLCVGHMTAENEHDFGRCIAYFAHPRYEIVATGDVYDGADRVGDLLAENKTAFPDFRFDIERMHDADEAIVVEGTFSGTHRGTWRGLPATGRRVDFPMLIVFRFEGDQMMGERVFFDLNTALCQLGVAHDPSSVMGKVRTAANHPLTVGRALLRTLVRPSGRADRDRGPRPEGRLGPPLLGESLALQRNPFGFLEERQRRHGNVFKTNILGRKVVFLAGLQGAEAFYDGDNVTRSDAHPFPLVDLFGGVNMEMYDGPRHVALKAMALTAFDRAALGRYLPDMQRLIESTLERLARAGELSATDELRELAIRTICLNVLGLSGSETESIARDYAAVLAGLVAVPLPLPFTTYGRARAARDRLLQRIREVIAERRAVPGDDGLSAILAAVAPDGRVFTDEEAVLEIHHSVIAGLIVYAHMAEGLRQLAEQPDLLRRCEEEVARAAPSGPLTLDALADMPTLTNTVLEAKRSVPLVPFAFGKARRTFHCGGVEVPEGWRVYLALHLNNNDPAIYAEPTRFDPDRFSAARAEHERHPMAFIPQGAGPPTGHACLGYDYSTVLASAFLALAVRGYTWELPAQDLGYDWSTMPPQPRDGLRVRLTVDDRKLRAR